MTAYLLNLSIGPVQPFIAAARRTRDLWFGSRLLSEICLEAARAVRETSRPVRNGDSPLIFPNESALNGKDEPNVANVIIALVDDPQEAARKAREAAQACLERYGDQVLSRFSNVIDENLWRAQLSDALEFFAAWVPCKGDADYDEARKRLASLMAARKNVRDFAPPLSPPRPGLKSSLDGRNEALLVGKDMEASLLNGKIGKAERYRLRLKRGEALDAMGLIKRAAEPKTGDRKTFSPVDRIAATPWLKAADSLCLDLMQNLHDAWAATIGASESKNGWNRYEGEVFPGRLEDFKEETGWDTALLEEALKALTEKLGEPFPYLAIVKADGDKMGKAISTLTTIEGHQNFSDELAAFACQAREIVKKHDGACVYAGGDDVLALLPLETCLSCARELAKSFADSFAKTKEALKKEDHPTLSVGIAVGHFLEPLEDLLRFADEAERMAKEPDRDGLAVVVRSRGNAPIAVRGKWGSELDKRLLYWKELFATGGLPSRYPYELRRLVGTYENWDSGDDVAEALMGDISRVFGRKELRLSDPEKETLKNKMAGHIKELASARHLEDLVLELLVARHLAEGEPPKEVRS
ncbi:type III-B CRISPR-associated protein Cas10/Cmr2 [Aminithiophilus ramosus]|uniref:Type III-B CRISPR-associated protein Cas10/Cmr2 n=2 Tax=Synergistales TaxID=649776 RepID=A0A9Q7A780_9BACT|nr:type III-B CRISPR-associated protein Cas10/Cmr2 [Aminithiophilus ramosus]QTX32130.1 type III-B CRISPR-associated protein Cas10/Cmr2 [Aminithiophilus ramosus]QVL35998.1 type III-B CRISPR-associated protein Cas10/Cmr2 [Synergistota bacterium]